MARYAGIRNNRICIVSDKIFNSNELEVIEIPDTLISFSASELMCDFKIKNGKIISKSVKKSASELKIALVSNWKMKCGIASFAENLWPEVIKSVGDYKLFIEEGVELITPINKVDDLIIPEDKIIQCWKRGESLQKLVNSIKEYDPDIIWIQHEFGLWPNARYWLSLLSQLSNYRIITTMHSVFHHKDKTICEAAIPEIVVHLEGAKKVLKEDKKIPGNVYVIPHGCYPCLSKEKFWNFYKSEKTFMQFGFGFRYKAWENSIKATAILKEKYPDVFFTGLFSESPYNKYDHQQYYDELNDLIYQLNIQENVALLRGYQSEETLNSYLRTNQATVFPYVSNPAHEVFGVSGAARVAMAKALPVITSSVNHFQDVPSIKADSPEQIAQELEKLFLNNSLKQEQINKQIKYIEENSWENVAAKYISLFETKIK